MDTVQLSVKEKLDLAFSSLDIKVLEELVLSRIMNVRRAL
jgi:hypothetical protein